VGDEGANGNLPLFPSITDANEDEYPKGTGNGGATTVETLDDDTTSTAIVIALGLGAMNSARGAQDGLKVGGEGELEIDEGARRNG
jgi:hypothetical protein